MSSVPVRSPLVLALQRGRVLRLRRDGMDVRLPKGLPYRWLRLRLSPRRLAVEGDRTHPPLADLLDAAFDPSARPAVARRETLLSLPLRGGAWAASVEDRAIQAVLLVADAAGAPARAALALLAEHAVALACPPPEAERVVVRTSRGVARLEAAPGPVALPGAGRRLEALRIAAGVDVWRHEAPLTVEIVPMALSAHARAAARARPATLPGLGGRIPRLGRVRVRRRRPAPGPGIPVGAGLAPSARAAWEGLA